MPPLQARGASAGVRGGALSYLPPQRPRLAADCAGSATGGATGDNRRNDCGRRRRGDRLNRSADRFVGETPGRDILRTPAQLPGWYTDVSEHLRHLIDGVQQGHQRRLPWRRGATNDEHVPQTGAQLPLMVRVDGRPDVGGKYAEGPSLLIPQDALLDQPQEKVLA